MNGFSAYSMPAIMERFPPGFAPTDVTVGQFGLAVLAGLSLMALFALHRLLILGVFIYPKQHPRRAELISEVLQLPYFKRLLWAPQLLELCLREGCVARYEFVRDWLRARRERRQALTRLLALLKTRAILVDDWMLPRSRCSVAPGDEFYDETGVVVDPSGKDLKQDEGP